MKLGIIIGSVRQGRSSDKLAGWIRELAEKSHDAEVNVLDLADYDLPFFNEPVSPQFNQNRVVEGDVRRWLGDVEAQEAFIIVTPEYNRSIPGVLKNALDFVAYEMKYKPVAIAAHGSSNGAQAVSHLRGILPGLHAITTPTFLGMPYGFGDSVGVKESDDSGNVERLQKQLLGMLTELEAYSGALVAIDR